MFNISKGSAPPFSLIAPFFMLGTFFYLVSSLLLPSFEANINHLDLKLVSWIHLFLLGYVMMIIFGAMAQLIPVVLEVEHFSIDFYHLIWPLLGVGTILMTFAFKYAPTTLSFGAILVMLAMVIFIIETMLTLRKKREVLLTTKTIIATNSFLLLGILIGFLMSLSFSNGIEIDISKWVYVHVMLLVIGFITLTIMGISLTLLPMFGLSHGFSKKPIDLSFKIITVSVLLFVAATLFDSADFKFLALLGVLAAILIYLYQIWLIYQKCARREFDIWFKSMLFGYGSLAFSLPLALIAFLSRSEQIVVATFWFFIMGFFAFLINGHLYKIVPFLVWFERFSPLVGKEPVPMLADMVPKKGAEYQFWFSALGVSVAGFGLLIENDLIFKSGASFIAIGAIFLFLNLIWMITSKKEKFR